MVLPKMVCSFPVWHSSYKYYLKKTLAQNHTRH